MTLTELRYIVAVAQERHFGRAAQRCFVSQPTLSIAIKKLEEELSVSLFDRSSNEVKPTETGERIITQAHRVLEEADRIKHLAASEQHELAGVFKLPLYDEPFFVIVPKGHEFEELDAVSVQQLTEQQVLLLSEGNCMRDQVLESCSKLASRQRILGLANTLQGSSINTIRHMVASGLGISVLPSSALTDNDHLLFSIIPFEPPAPNRRIVLASRRNFVRPQALQALRQAILKSQLTGVRFAEA